MGGKTQTVTQKNSPNPEAMAAYRDVLGRAKYVANKPYTPYTGQTVAGLNSTQTGAIQGLAGASGDIDTARGLAARGSAELDLSPEAMSRYMNPYIDSVINATMGNMQREDAIAQQGVVGNAISKGAWGGDRAGIAQAELARTQKLARDQAISQLRAQGYSEATALAMADRSAAMQGAQTSMGLAGANIDALKAALNAGTLQQTQSQNEMNDSYKRFLESRDYGKDTVSWLSGVTSGLGSLMGGTSAQTSPGPSALSQILGAASTILPFVLRSGGRVERAFGGGAKAKAPAGGLKGKLAGKMGGMPGQDEEEEKFEWLAPTMRVPGMAGGGVPIPRPRPSGIDAGSWWARRFDPEQGGKEWRGQALQTGIDMLSGGGEGEDFAWIAPTWSSRAGFAPGGEVGAFGNWISNRFRRTGAPQGAGILSLPGTGGGMGGGQGQTVTTPAGGFDGGFAGDPEHFFSPITKMLTGAWEGLGADPTTGARAGILGVFNALGNKLAGNAPGANRNPAPGSDPTGEAAAKQYGYDRGGVIPYLPDDDRLILPADPASMIPLLPPGMDGSSTPFDAPPEPSGPPPGIDAGLAMPSPAGATPAADPGLSGGIAPPRAPARPRPSPAASGAFSPVEGASERANAAMSYFIEQGYTPAQAAGIVGNLMQESGHSLDTSALGDSGTSFGVAQWHDEKPGVGRWTNLRNWATEQGLDPADFQTQLAFINHELNTSERSVGERLRGATTPEDAAAAFIGFERPLGYSPSNPTGGHGWDNRLNNTLMLAGSVPPVPGTSPVVTADPVNGGPPRPGSVRPGGPSGGAPRGLDAAVSPGRDAPERGRRSLSDKFREDAWRLPVLMAGLNMLAGTSPNAGANIGSGAAAGLDAWQRMQEGQANSANAERENALAERRLTLSERELDLKAQQLEHDLAGGDEAPEIQDFFDEETGRSYKAQWNSTTRSWDRVGGVEGPPADDSAPTVQEFETPEGTVRKQWNPTTRTWDEVPGTVAEAPPAPGAPTTKDIETADGLLAHQWNPTTSTWDPIAGAVPKPADTPTDVETYEYYVAQEEKNGREPKDFEAWVLQKARAGAPPAQESYISAEMAKRYFVWADAADKATSTLGTLELMDELTQQPGFYSGWNEGIINQWKRLGEAAGFDTGVESVDAFRSMANKMVIDTMGSLGASISNSDRDFYRDMFPNLANTPDGNELVIEVGRRVNERAIEKARAAEAYRAAHDGNIDAGFLAEWAAYMEANPMFADLVDDAEADPAAPAGSDANPAPRPPVGYSTQTEDGTIWVYKGGDPNDANSWERQAPAGGP